MNHTEAADELRRLSRLIDGGIEALRDQAHALAEAENSYRRSKAEAWLRCPTDEPGVKSGEREWTAARREAWVNAETGDLRMARDIAEGVRQAALEAVRARRTQMSALQSLLAADRAEAEFARTGP
jgi:hypothetical protein